MKHGTYVRERCENCDEKISDGQVVRSNRWNPDLAFCSESCIEEFNDYVVQEVRKFRRAIEKEMTRILGAVK